MRKNSKKTGRISSARVRRLAWIGIFVAVFGLATTAAVSRRASQAKDSTPRPSAGQTKDKAHAGMSFRLGGQIPLDPQTGQVRPLTQEEAQRMADGIKQLVNQSTDGLKSVQHSDGTVSIDLQGRFQNMAVAKRDEDGKLIQSCVDNREAAAAFFGVDPQLVGAQGSATKTGAPVSEKGGNR